MFTMIIYKNCADNFAIYNDKVELLGTVESAH